MQWTKEQLDELIRQTPPPMPTSTQKISKENIDELIKSTPAFGEKPQEELRAEKPDPLTIQRMKDVELATWKTEQERKARKYLRWLYEAGYQYSDAATLGLVKKILTHEEDMPPDVIRDIIGQAAHFAGFLATPLAIGKLGVGIGERIGAKLLPKIIKSPKILAWLEKIGAKAIPQGIKAMGRSAATLGLASTISDLTKMKDAVKRGEAGALMGLIFGGTSFAHLTEHPVISQMIRQVGGRALLSIANLYDPQVWKSLNKEQIAHRVYDELLNSWFLAKGYNLKDAAAKAARVKDLIESNKPASEIMDEANIQPTLFTAEELTRVTPWIKKPPEISEKPPVSTTAETTVNIKPRPDGSVDVTLKKPSTKIPTENLLSEEGFKKAYRERTLPEDLTVEKMTPEQKRWAEEVESEGKKTVVPAIEELRKERRKAIAREVAARAETEKKAIPTVPEEEKISIEQIKDIYHPDRIFKIAKIPEGYTVETRVEGEWSPMTKANGKPVVYKTRWRAEKFLEKEKPKQLEIYKNAVDMAREEGRLVEEEQPAQMLIKQPTQEEAPTETPNIKKRTGIRSKDFEIKVNRIIPEIVKAHNENGGSTFNIYTGNQDGQDAYVVSVFPELTKHVSGRTITEKDIRDFIEENAELLKDPRLSVGTYYDKDVDRTDLDVVVTTKKKSRAVKWGKKYNQKYAWYLKEGIEIPTGGTGEIPENIKKEPLDERLRIKGAKRKLVLYHFSPKLDSDIAVVDPHAMGTGRMGAENHQFKENGELKDGYLLKSNWYGTAAKTIEPHLWVGTTLYRTEVPTSELLYASEYRPNLDIIARDAGKIGWYSPEHGQARIFIPLEAKRVGVAGFSKTDRVNGRNLLTHIKAAPPSRIEKLSKKIAEQGTQSLTDEELNFLKQRGIFQEIKPPEKKIRPQKKAEETKTFIEEQPEKLVDVYAKTPLGKTEKVETIPEGMVEEIKKYVKKKKIEDLITFGNPRQAKWKNYLSKGEVKKYVKDYIRTLPRVPEGTPEEEAWKIWQAKIGNKEEERIKEEEEAVAEFQKKVEKDPNNITPEDLPFDGVINNKKLANFTSEVHKAATKKAWRAATMVEEALTGKKVRQPQVIRRNLDKAGMILDDELMENIEEAYAKKVASTARGYVEKTIQKMKDAGVRDEVINRIRIMDRYPITKLIKVKREKTGVHSAVISKDLIEYIKEHYKRRPEKRFMRKTSPAYLIKNIKRIARGFEVPQLFFKRIGLKEVIYDEARQGERDAETLFRRELPNIQNIFANLDKAERKQLFDYMASKERRSHAMEKAGIKPPKLSDLNMKQQLALIKWRKWIGRFTPQLKELAKLYGLDIKFFRNYFPLYTKRDLIDVSGIVDYPKGIRKSPFFKSFVERSEDVPYKLYERDAYKNAVMFLKGMSEALNMGKRTIALKYLIDSNEFKDIVNKDDYTEILDWYQNLVGSVAPNRGARKVASLVARQLRRWSTRAILTNPRVVLKQVLSGIDVALLENTKFIMPDDVRQLVERLERPTVTERVPEIAMVDMRSKADRALLSGVSWMDKTVAHGGYSIMLGAELMKMKKEGIRLDNQALRKAVRRVSDRLDLAMGGYTRAQTPHFYRTELGKAILMFTSTINSRFQYYIENTIEGIQRKDAVHVAKAMTAFVLGGYLEASITRLALNWQDSKEMLKDILKTTIGNIPPFASLIYGLEAGEFAPTAWFKNINDAVAAMKKPWSRRLVGIAEIFGLPKQIRHTIEGMQAIKKGIKVSSSETLELKDNVDKIRALINGKWGTLTARQYFAEKERKSGWNKEIAKKLAKIQGRHFRVAIKSMTTSRFKKNFWNYVNALSDSDKKKIKEIIREARKQGIKLSYQSVLRHLKEEFNE